MAWMRSTNLLRLPQCAPRQNVTNTQVSSSPQRKPSPPPPFTTTVVRAIADDFVSSAIASLNHCSRLSSTIPTTSNSITCMPSDPTCSRALILHQPTIPKTHIEFNRNRIQKHMSRSSFGFGARKAVPHRHATTISMQPILTFEGS